MDSAIPAEHRSCRRRRTGRALAIALTLMVAAGCATRTRHEWLVLFFDGVPPEPGTETNAAHSVAGSVAHGTSGTNAPAPPLPKIVIHAPYGDRECNGCHESAFSQKMKGPLKDVCLGCHADLLDKAKSTHSPVDAGECLQCHNPHQSPRKFLLTKKPTELCIECHDDMSKVKTPHAPVAGGECLECHKPHVSDQPHLLARKKSAICTSCHDGTADGKTPHAPAKDGDCVECHKPHGSDLPHMLARKGGDLCLSCHEKFTAKVMHSPAAEGECLSCHQPHVSSEPALLKKSIKSLCYDCHDKADVESSTTHKTAGDSACTICHDPHGSDQKLMLKPGKDTPASPAPRS